ncbi:MAG: hypothetical protein GY859_08890 [Desulfobacterales bacterium]|nr:hypothetical protein [Desulfobacterales bacterium]
MADVISFNEKLKYSREKQAALIRQRKILMVRKVFQCTQCPFKCEKCGAHLEQAPQQDPGKESPKRIYRFCESCQEEYNDYLERLRGGGDPDCYWHNDDWLQLWRSWIDYQGATDRYMKSKAFTRLLQELKQSQPE